MKRVLAFLAVLLFAAPALAGELVMFQSAGCPWCQQWDRDVGAIYHKSAEGKVLPLRRVNIKDERPADLAHIGGVVYTPTFVVLDNGSEVGRIQGYPGEDTFWWMLGRFVEQVVAARAAREVSSLSIPDSRAPVEN